jgi:hypothetical protein
LGSRAEPFTTCFLQALLSSKIDNPRGELGMTGAPLVKAAVALLRDYEKGDGR